MKKIIPILVLSSIGLVLSGCTGSMNVQTNLRDNVEIFTNSVKDYLNTANSQVISTLNKYMVTVEDNLEEINTEESSEESIENNKELDTETTEDVGEQLMEDEDSIDEEDDENDVSINEEISTLYSLSCDIEESCDEFCELKEDITEAIIETERLLTKIQNNELDLTTEQKMFIAEQSNQLRTISRELSKITNELSFQLTDLSSLQATNLDPNNLSLKYLLVLNNILNGNEMLSNSLASLSMINQMAYLQQMNSLGNNTGRVLYGFQRNNEPPIIKEYEINEDGEITENTNNEENQVDTTGVDSYTNTNLTTNIDSYGTNYKNIDTFFNTALLDNEFMYGNGGYPMNGMYGMNPYMNQYRHYPNQNLQYPNNVEDNQLKIEENQQNNSNNQEKTSENTQSKRKKFKFTKNIDTYRDDNAPDLKSKIVNIKNSVKGFFAKINPNQDNIKNPIYREDDN